MPVPVLTCSTDIVYNWGQNGITVSLTASATNSPTSYQWRMIVPEGSTDDVGVNGDFNNGISNVQDPDCSIQDDIEGTWVFKCVATNGDGPSVPIEYEEYKTQTKITRRSRLTAQQFPGDRGYNWGKNQLNPLLKEFEKRLGPCFFEWNGLDFTQFSPTRYKGSNITSSSFFIRKTRRRLTITMRCDNDVASSDLVDNIFILPINVTPPSRHYAIVADFGQDDLQACKVHLFTRLLFNTGPYSNYFQGYCLTLDLSGAEPFKYECNKFSMNGWPTFDTYELDDTSQINNWAVPFSYPQNAVWHRQMFATEGPPSHLKGFSPRLSVNLHTHVKEYRMQTDFYAASNSNHILKQPGQPAIGISLPTTSSSAEIMIRNIRCYEIKDALNESENLRGPWF